MSAEAEAAAAAWWPSATPKIQTLGSGHINDTYLASVGADRAVLQCLNTQVFRKPERVLANTRRVLAQLAREDVPTAQLLDTATGADSFQDPSGNLWRLWSFVDGRTLTAPTLEEARAAGFAFGRLQRALRDLPGPPLEPAIEGFLELAGYLRDLDDSCAAERPSGLREELGRIDAGRELAAAFAPRGDVVHGDCKIDNLLFAADAPEVLAIVDLDTVMVGHWAWDLGDLTRSLATIAGELPIPLLVAAARGFLEGRGEGAALEVLLGAPRYLTLMLAVRFLDDHLRGDVYFKVAERGENLSRARRQLELLSALEAQADALRTAYRTLPGVEP